MEEILTTMDRVIALFLLGFFIIFIINRFLKSKIIKDKIFDIIFKIGAMISLIIITLIKWKIGGILLIISIIAIFILTMSLIDDIKGVNDEKEDQSKIKNFR